MNYLIINIRLLSLTALLVLQGFCSALASGDSVVFSRQKVTINAVRYVEQLVDNKDDSKEITGNNISENSDNKNEQVGIDEDEENPEIELVPQKVSYVFNATVRPLSLVLEGGLQQLSWMKHDEAVMLTMDRNDIISLANINIPKAIDLILIRPNGKIDAIAPSITPDQLQDDIEAARPVNAIVIINAGMAEHLSIKPGNRVNHDYFKPEARVIR